jgi:hypothetical protein
MTNGRSRLGTGTGTGTGTGETLNAHILGDAWPPTHLRLDMPEEAIQVMRSGRAPQLP